jgi:chemotaxis protein MotB
MADEQPIIVIKKKINHAGHHGGAWKVAYADFVTAMMALFIVLWLLSSTSKQTQEEIAGYFNDPKGISTKHGNDGKSSKEEKPEAKKDDLAALQKDLLRAIARISTLNSLKKQIEITLTDEGLRIELVEDAKGTFFESGSAKATPALEEVLKVLTEQLKGLPNHISIEGHTDAQPYAVQTIYGNWELSTDRANVARREMQVDGIRLDQVSQVRGFADQRLHNPDKPFDASNRRVSLVVQNLQMTPKQLIASAAEDKAKMAEVAKTEGAEKGKAEGAEKAKPEGSEKSEAPATEKAESPSNKEAKPAAMALPPSIPKPAAGMLARVKGIFKK